MQKILFHLLWVLILFGINLCSLSISIYSMFAIEKGTNLTNWDYSLAVFILIVSNFITFQLFFAIKMNQKQNALFGIVIAFIQMISFILFMNLHEIAGISIFSISVIASVIMIIKTWKQKKTAF